MQNRQLFNDLRALANVHSPARVLEAILDEIELSDRYASLETALGPVFVAWNRQGVSAVMKTATPDEFESRFRERFHRTPRPAPQLPRLPERFFDLRSVWQFAPLARPCARTRCRCSFRAIESYAATATSASTPSAAVRPSAPFWRPKGSVPTTSSDLPDGGGPARAVGSSPMAERPAPSTKPVTQKLLLKPSSSQLVLPPLS